MDSGLTAAFVKANRDRLRQALKLTNNDFAIVPAHFKLQKTHDEAYKFVQDNNFFYLTGIKEPDCLVVVTKDDDMLLSPPIDPHHQLWEGQAGIENLQQTSGVSTVLTGKSGVEMLRQLAGSAKKVFLPLPYDARIMRRYYRMLPNPARARLHKRLRNYNPKLQFNDIRPALAQLRMIKQPPEIAAISQAIEVTLGAIEAVHKNLHDLSTERDVHALLEYEFLRGGADGPGFDSIVASGRNTTQIHYMGNNNTPLDKNLVLLDVGAQINGYKADISRVVSQVGFTPRQQTIHDAVEALQAYAFSILKPGITLREFEDLVEHKTEELTADLQLTKHKTRRRKQRITPHAVSHHLGLDAHDAADYEAQLQPGMVLAVEPGIYLLDEGIGMRIEDDVLITEQGIKILSSRLPARSH